MKSHKNKNVFFFQERKSLQRLNAKYIELMSLTELAIRNGNGNIILSGVSLEYYFDLTLFEQVLMLKDLTGDIFFTSYCEQKSYNIFLK